MDRPDPSPSKSDLGDHRFNYRGPLVAWRINTLGRNEASLDTEPLDLQGALVLSQTPCR